MYKKSQYNNYITKRESDGFGLFYNASTGAIAWLNQEVQDALENNCIDQLKTKDYFPSLIKNGFVVSDIIDEYERYSFKARQFVMDLNSDFASYIIALTMECNLKLWSVILDVCTVLRKADIIMMQLIIILYNQYFVLLRTRC